MSGRTYSGSPVTLDFQGSDLRAVLRTFAEISGLNIVIDPAVTGTVDVDLRDVPWDQALDQILRTNKLGYMVDGTIVRIAPLAILEAEAKSQAALVVAQADARPGAVLRADHHLCRGVRRSTLREEDTAGVGRPQPSPRLVEDDHLDLVLAFGILRTPTVLVLDAAGRETARASGAMSREQADAALAVEAPC